MRRGAEAGIDATSYRPVNHYERVPIETDTAAEIARRHDLALSDVPALASLSISVDHAIRLARLFGPPVRKSGETPEDADS